MGGARDLPQYQVIPRPGRRRNSPAWLLLERTRQDWINCKMKQKTSLQICFGTRSTSYPVSVPQGPRRAGQRLLGIGSDRQTHAQERRADGQRGRDRPDQGGHGGAPSFDGAWWNVMAQSQCAHMLAKLLAKQPPPASVAKSIIGNGGIETLLTAARCSWEVPGGQRALRRRTRAGAPGRGRRFATSPSPLRSARASQRKTCGHKTSKRQRHGTTPRCPPKRAACT